MSEHLDKGQRLYCRKCHSEIEIINPCTCDPPDQVLQCCGQDMIPTPGSAVHLNEVESSA
ncbi:hypothetical protein BH23PLA1_BH23PLA1_25180 [soil metagenome]